MGGGWRAALADIQIVHKPGEVFKTDFSSGPGKSQSFIVYLDSFGLIDNRLIQIIKMLERLGGVPHFDRYLHKYFSEKSQTESSFADSNIAGLAAYQPLVPRQVNYIDCGCFLLEYAEAFLACPEYIVEDIHVGGGG